MRAVVFSLVFLFPLPLLAQTVCGSQDYGSATPPNFECPMPGEEAMIPRLQPPASISVSSGETLTAPWEGALVHRDRLVLVGLRVQALRRLHWADRLRLQEEAAITLEHAQELCGARIERVEAISQSYQDALDRANEQTHSANAWYRSWWFGFILGTATTTALVALATYIVISI